MNVRQILARHAEHHRMIVVADRQDDVAARGARAGRRAPDAVSKSTNK